MMRPLTKSRFQEELLRIMDRKHHWAWPAFTDGTVTINHFKRHFQQEYGVYVRDFPVLLARIHGHNPPPAVRRMLAENIYEEDTGGLSMGKSHPELFLNMMAGHTATGRTPLPRVARSYFAPSRLGNRCCGSDCLR
jgi:pyrroloquinoline quinone (PQQ) biosynthesis protein C